MWSRLVFFVASASLVGTGCIFEAETPEPTPKPEPETFLTPDSPANALHNVRLACERRDFESYKAALAPEFRFLFPAPGEEAPVSCRTGTWTLDDELKAMERLFAWTELERIRVSFPHGEAEPASEVGMEGTWRIRVTDHYLEVTAPPNAWVSKDDLHEFYFRAGKESAGENPQHWFLLEWREILLQQKPAPLQGGPTPVLGTHWSQIKCLFAD
jgi:hypothetical protein